MADNQDNYPGFDLHQRMFLLYGAAAQEQGERWNDMWRRLAKGEYQFGDWMKDLSQGASAHFRLMESMAKAPFPDVGGPVWVRMTWGADEAEPPSTVITLNRAIAGTPTPIKFAGLGGGSNDLTCEWIPITAGNRVRLQLSGTKPAAGDYIGLLTISESRHAPEAILLLQVH